MGHGDCARQSNSFAMLDAQSLPYKHQMIGVKFFGIRCGAEGYMVRDQI
jgi:hypothetical protein